MEDSTEIDVTQKKSKKTHLETENQSGSLEDNSDEPRRVIPNGTGNSSKGDISEEDHVSNKTKAIKITKITKSSKTDAVKDKTKNLTVSPSKKVSNENPTKIQTPSGSPSSSSLSGDFYGFKESTESNEQQRRKEAFNRFLSSLEDVGDKDEESEVEAETEAMTAEDADAADSDSNQMEIDEGNSHADSAELSDKNEKGRTNSDVDVMEIDSVKSGEDTSVKTEEEGAKTLTDTAAVPESAENQPKVEYCGNCSEMVDDAEEGICCDGKCERWFHLQCSGLTQAEYDELGRDENAKWACSRCSGKPPPVIKPGAKPLLTVRKDLTAIETPSPKRKITNKEEKRPRVDISNPIFLKPFDYGWKRELVYRSTTDSQNKKQGDVYYYTPKGKKLRSLREISEHLIGTDLTVDNFTFWKDALGCDPEKEIIRDAKIKLTNKDSNSNASPSPAAKKLGTPKTPKTPKTTPKLTATVTPLDSASGLPVAKASASVTPRVVLKTGKTGSVSTGPKFKVTPSKTTTPGQTQKVVISKGDEKATREQQLSNKINISKNDKEPINEEKNLVKEKYQVDKDNLAKGAGEVENEGDDIEIVPKNKFRRYGLLANRISTRNARNRRSKSSSSSSSGSSEELSPEKQMKTSIGSKLDSVKAASLKSRENDNVQSRSKTDDLVFPPLTTSIINGKSNKPLPPPGTFILPNPNLKRPRSPEIQFRPSDASSYGYQTKAVPPCRPIGLNMSGVSSSFRHPFETVLIVDTLSAESIVNSPKPRTAPYKSPSPVQWTHDCSIEVTSVETLPSKDGFSNESYVVASPSRQTGLPPKKQSPFVRSVESSRNALSTLAKNSDECSPISVASSSTDIVVIEEDVNENSCPPFLMRNSPPPKLRRSNISPSHSPPNLQANLPMPPLLPCPSLLSCSSRTVVQPCSNTVAENSPVITINFAEDSLSSLTSNEATQPNETGSKYEEYRKFKRERFYERRKANQEMEKLKKSYQKERKLFISRKSEEKKLQIEYLRLKVKIKAMKLSLMKKKDCP